VLAVVLVLVLRRANGHGKAVAPTQDGGALYFQLAALAQDVRTLSQLVQDVRSEQTHYHSGAEKVANIRHDQVVRSIEAQRDALVDHQQAVERRLPAA